MRSGPQSFRPAVRYRYWNMMRNCGDSITSFILDRCFGLSPTFAEPDTDHLCAVGSILMMSNRHSWIWGSGILGPKWTIPPLDVAKITALRGHRSLALLKSQGYELGDIPLGDTGIFVSDIFSVEEKEQLRSERNYKVAFVPHHSAIDRQEFQRYAGNDEICIVNMIADNLKPVIQILQSDLVVSQSLHGLVFAEAFGKPSVWISHTDDEDWCFKFQDWYSTTRKPQHKPFPLATPLDELVKSCRVAEQIIDKQALRRVFPMDCLSMQINEGLIPYDKCREYRVALVDFDEDVFGDVNGLKGNGKARSEAQWQVSQAFKSFFASWSEPVYACLKSCSSELDPDDIQAATCFLDKNIKHEFVFLNSNPSLTDKIRDRPTFTWNNRKLAIVEAAAGIGGAVVLRPHGWFSLTSTYATLVPLS